MQFKHDVKGKQDVMESIFHSLECLNQIIIYFIIYYIIK